MDTVGHEAIMVRHEAGELNPNMRYSTTMKIGRIYANIAGDSRYCQMLEVHLEGNEVTVQIWETSPVGGMDGPGGCYPTRCRVERKIENCTGKALAAVIKDFIGYYGDTIRHYGKPMKNFIWYGDGCDKLRGYSAKTCQVALDANTRQG